MKKGRIVFVSVLISILLLSAAVAAVELLGEPEFGVNDDQRFAVTFRTSTSSMSHVEYGETEDLGEATAQHISLDNLHEHVLENVNANTTYAYRIVIQDFGGGETVHTGTFTTPALGTVSSLAVKSTSDQLATLSWEPAFGAAAYQVQRGTDENGPFEVIATVSETEYVDDDVTQAGSHVYRVAPVTREGVVGEPSPAAKASYMMMNLTPWMNNLGIASLSNVSDLSPGLDGDGFGFAAEVLPQGDFEIPWQDGIVVPFLGFRLGQGQNDNIVTLGQEIDVPKGSYSTLWLLVASSWGESFGINIALRYSDGSEAIYSISAPDWCQDDGSYPGRDVFTGSRYSTGGVDGLQCSMRFLPPLNLNSNKELVSIRLPYQPMATLGNTSFHIFALTLGI